MDHLEYIIDAMVPLLFESNVLHYFTILLLPRRQPVIHACVRTIPVFKVRQIFYPSTRHLQSGIIYSVVVQCPIEVALLVLQGPGLLKEK